MSMILMHATAKDIEILRLWLNAAPDLAWIVKTGQSGSTHHWRAIRQLDHVHPQEYVLWHVSSGDLNIPSGDRMVPDTVVADPFLGWSQPLEGTQTTPWFGANLPGPYHLRFHPQGQERPDSIGRSEFHWAQGRFKCIGNPASPAAKDLWRQLQRFVARSSTRRPWPDVAGRYSVHVFPDALEQHLAGRHLDVNP
ncbi:hypothetical protein QSH18_10620 [Xanthomonas sp. NCPPB 2654]|uniref:hypothetical protein n=1 Tax=unclassified Xanthomonas TaxID=2643310 RepID=UPI0021DFE93D|nr:MULTISPECIES: hypothetical protein [unclassified Xanthomonas]MDL5366059.1 hypothetical protein [Xanthomonas sp. NCPPB 2654]UYC20757.1 hypothetical protein NUG20_00120 [Xanthomonas sp. CFBP 8443]